MQPSDFNWSNGCVFVQDGIIYCSPNSSRPVVIPPKSTHSSSPFSKPEISISMFHQPVWWTDAWGWLSFVPLSPSFTARPFEPFCWMPNIEEFDGRTIPPSTFSEKQYRMRLDDMLIWKWLEDLIVFALHKLRLWHHVPGSLPPKPSVHHFDRPQKSKTSLTEVISAYRDWFGIWMGFMSYYVAAAENESYCGSGMNPDPLSPVPKWYLRLKQEHLYSESWLDGLMRSPVGDFDPRIVRAGVVYEWFDNRDWSRLSVDFFLQHNIPVYFPWTATAEATINVDRSRRYLKPPDHMVKDALDRIFKTKSNIPLGALVMRCYFELGESSQNTSQKLVRLKDATSFVFNYLINKMAIQGDILLKALKKPGGLDQELALILAEREAEQEAAAKAAASLPTQTIIELDKDDEKGQLYDSWSTFFERRKQRQAEILAVENERSRQVRETRERNPPTRNTKMFTWHTIRSSGGIALFMRVRITKANFESLYAMTPKSQKVYNAISNEWDLCNGFKPPIDLAMGEDDDHDVDYGDDSDDSDSNHDDDPANSCPPKQSSISVDSPPILLPREENNRVSNDDFGSYDHPPENPNMFFTGPVAPAVQMQVRSLPHQPQEYDMGIEELFDDEYAQWVDMVESLRLSFGFVPRLGGDSGNPPNGWPAVVQAFGFVNQGAEATVRYKDREDIINFCNAFILPDDSPLLSDIFDLHQSNYQGLAHSQDIKRIHRPSEDLFVFCHPRSKHRPDKSDWMLGVQSPQAALYVARTLVCHPNHTIDTAANRLVSHGIPFRTLMGQIESPNFQFQTIAQKYEPTSFREANHVFTPDDFVTAMLQCKDFLNRPQGRAALLKGGIIGRIAQQYLSMDAILEGPSVEVMEHHRGFQAHTGTPHTQYVDDELTEQDMAVICGTYSLHTEFRGQVAIKSWFPPHSIWFDDRNAFQWLEWTERNEAFFNKRLEEIRSGGGQPLSNVEWKNKLRGNKLTKTVNRSLRKHTKAFIDEHVPVQAPVR